MIRIRTRGTKIMRLLTWTSLVRHGKVALDQAELWALTYNKNMYIRVQLYGVPYQTNQFDLLLTRNVPTSLHTYLDG